jgi:hypothetical protein
MRKRASLIIIGLFIGMPLAEAPGETKSEDFEVKTLSPLSASGNKKGDKFTVQVLTPEKYKDALIEGEVANSKASGKVKGKSELLFRFNKLIQADKTEVPIQADLAEIKNSKGVANVDEEGRAIGKSSKAKDAMKVGLLGGIGAAIGGATGGGSGAATGAAIGAGIGLTIAFSTTGEDIRLEPGSIFVLRVTETSK